MSPQAHKPRGRAAPVPSAPRQVGTAAEMAEHVQLQIAQADDEIATLERKLEQRKLERANLHGQLYILGQLANANPATIEHGSEDES